jgi:hypothetical protein
MSVRGRFFSHNGKDFVELKVVGDPNTVMLRVEPQHIHQFASEWAAYQGGKTAPEPDGLPLTEIPGVSDNMAMAFRLKGVRTVEEFAELSDAAVKALGMGALTLRKNAVNLLDAQKARAMAGLVEAAKPRRGRPRKDAA